MKRIHFLFSGIAAMLMFGTTAVSTARADGTPFVGVDAGVMLPLEVMKDYVDTGGTVAPFGGYMFNDYIGIMGQLHLIGGRTEHHLNHDGGGTTLVGGGTIGPRVAIPLGPVELYATAQGGWFTSLADEALTDSSAAISAGAGVNYALTEKLSIGGFGRWNRLYQRIHGAGDAKYVTTGIGLTYFFRDDAPPPPPPPPAVVQAPAPPPPPPAKRVIKTFVMQGVHFDFDRSTIRPDGRTVLNDVVKALADDPTTSIVVEGHTDSKGTNEYNQKLSLRRAQAVEKYLVENGIAASRIEVEGFGETKPKASNETASGRAENRRVEIKLMGQ